MLALAAAGCLAGCVEREMVITTDPPGARVFVSDQEVGRSPVTRTFTHYGDYDVILRMDGYKTIKTHAKLNPPWYQWPVVDFFSEIAPWTCRDRRYLHYKLTKFSMPPEKELIKRAEALKKRNRVRVED